MITDSMIKGTIYKGCPLVGYLRLIVAEAVDANELRLEQEELNRIVQALEALYLGLVQTGLHRHDRRALAALLEQVVLFCAQSADSSSILSNQSGDA